MDKKPKLGYGNLASFLVSAALGAAIWALSPLVTGDQEPWDAQPIYYFACLLATGFIAGILFPKNTWPVLPGVVLGQLIYMFIALPSGPLLLLGIVFLVTYGLISWAAAFAAALVRRYWQS